MASLLVIDSRSSFQADLARWGHTPSFTQAVEEAAASVKRGAVDVVVIGPTAREAASACAQLVDQFPQVPVIVASNDEATRKRSARAGAWEVAAATLDALESSVRRAVEVRRLRVALEQRPASSEPAPTSVEATPSLEILEREHIFRVLSSVKGHRTKAAQLLGLDRKTLYRKLSRYRAEGLTS
ncbi:MAG: helix-turn-helix domain-containing protein [Myxococcaceae bacterium]